MCLNGQIGNMNTDKEPWRKIQPENFTIPMVRPKTELAPGEHRVHSVQNSTDSIIFSTIQRLKDKAKHDNYGGLMKIM